MNVVLIYPKTGMDFGSTIAPPHALLTIAAPLVKAGYSVKILDQRIEDITKHTPCLCYDGKIRNTSILEAEFGRDATLCVGISCMTGTQVGHAIEIARQIRRINPLIPLVWGGPHPSVIPVQTSESPLVDYVVVGEGDYAFKYIVDLLKLGEKPNKITIGKLVEMETLLPTPWELVDVEKYIHPDMYLKGKRVLDIGQTSRGCPFKCGFCSSASIRQRKWRPMSVGRSVYMITDAVKRFKLDGIWLRDDEFYIDRKRATAICEAIKSLGIKFYTSGTRVDVFSKATDHEVDVLKEAGAYVLKFGAESGCQRTLDRMQKGITPNQTLYVNKRCLKHGIKPAYSLMIGYLGETFEEIDKTIDFSFQIKKDNPNAELETMAIYTALPGTPDYEIALSLGLKVPNKLEGWKDWIFDEYDFEGKRSPWYSRKERIWLGNISYMSILSNALPNVIGSVRNRVLRGVGQVLVIPISAFYRWRLKNKWYRFAPDLMIVRWLRRRIMY